MTSWNIRFNDVLDLPMAEKAMLVGFRMLSYIYAKQSETLYSHESSLEVESYHRFQKGHQIFWSDDRREAHFQTTRPVCLRRSIHDEIDHSYDDAQHKRAAIYL